MRSLRRSLFVSLTVRQHGASRWRILTLGAHPSPFYRAAKRGGRLHYLRPIECMRSSGAWRWRAHHTLPRRVRGQQRTHNRISHLATTIVTLGRLTAPFATSLTATALHTSPVHGAQPLTSNGRSLARSASRSRRSWPPPNHSRRTAGHWRARSRSRLSWAATDPRCSPLTTHDRGMDCLPASVDDTRPGAPAYEPISITLGSTQSVARSTRVVGPR